MPNSHRLAGRFFSVLISVTFAILLTRGAVADSGLTLCQITSTVYRADGAPAQGSIVLLWPAFTTAAGQPVAAGSLTVALGVQGQFSAALAPNTGASPAGSYYRATYKLNDGTTTSEYWVVPAAPTSTIGAIRSKLVPANQAAQFLTRDFADSHYLNLTDNQTVAGAKIFTTPPAVPPPANPTDAANKAYVDANQGNGANLASPPPIGTVSPNSATFTVLDNVPNAAAFPGADPCAKINAAIASLPATGGPVDARGFQGSATCAGTLLIDRYVNLLFGSVQLTLNGNPGIRITSYQPPLISGAGWMYAYTAPNGNGTVLISGVAAPLIVDLVSSGPQWRNLELNGNGIGTVAYVSQPNGGGGYLFEDIHIHSFLYAGIIAPGTGAFKGRIIIDDNGGDALLLGSSPTLEGDTEIANNGGNGIHTVGESAILKSPNVDRSGLNGIYVDGRVPPTTWVPQATWISPSLLHPSAGNPGNYFFYSENVNCTTGSSAPPWPQIVGNTVVDGSCIWLNVSTFNNNQAPVSGVAQSVMLDNANVARSGQTAARYGYAADNIRFEGDGPGNPTCSWNSITGGSVVMGSADDANNANGLHLLNCAFNTITNLVHMGRSYSYSRSPADGYGLILENSYDNVVSNFNSTWSTRSPVKLTNATANQFSNLGASCWSNSSVTGSDVYALQIDAASSQNQIANLVLDTACGRTNAKGVYNRGTSTFLDNYQLKPSTVLATLDDLGSANLTNAHGRQANVPVEFDVSGSPALAIDANGNTTLYGDLSARDIPGHEYFVSHYANLQAAINAAYNNGAVLGTVIDDRTAPYTGAGFILYDSVTLKLAPTTYTLNATVTYNNGNNNVIAGIVVLPGAHLLGASTSTNHGTIVTAANGFNADLVATSTVGTGTATPQWWHWGEIANLRLIGNGANQTAGECLKIENMGEVASLHDLELSACYGNNLENIGYAATQSAIANITSNRSVHGSGIAITNLSGVAILNGISGDCNQTSLIAANFNAAGTLTIHGLKAEAELSICNPQAQDPVILASTTDGTVLASVKVDGGYAFGTTQNAFLKSSGPGTIQYQQENFYLNGYTNILNDTVRGQLLANAATTTKQPVFYLSNGVVYGNQAFTLQPNTFVQANPNGTPTEIFGVTSSSAALLADPGNGDNSSILAGGIQVAGHNRATFGQSPEIMARWGYRFLGPGAGYDTTKWDLVPAWNTADTTEKNLGNPLTVCQKGGAVSCRWSNLYALNVDTTSLKLNGNSLATVATTGSYSDLSNKPAIPVQGSHIVVGTLQGVTGTLTGNGLDQTIYSATLPAGTFATGQGAKCFARWTHSSTSTAVTYKWTLGSATVAYGSMSSASQNFDSEIEIYTIASLAAQIINLSPLIGGTSILAGPSNGSTGAENLANADTIKFTFNMPSSDWVKGATFYCQTVQ